MKKIQRASRFLRLFFLSLCWFLPLLHTIIVFFYMEEMLNWGFWASVLPSTKVLNPHFSILHRLIILCIEFLSLSMTWFIFYKLAKLFALYEKGILFEEENIKLIKGISIFMLIGEFMQILCQPMLNIALTYYNPPVSNRIIPIGIGTANITTLVTALIILMASWILKEAHQIKSDYQLTI